MTGPMCSGGRIIFGFTEPGGLISRGKSQGLFDAIPRRHLFSLNSECEFDTDVAISSRETPRVQLSRRGIAGLSADR